MTEPKKEEIVVLEVIRSKDSFRYRLFSHSKLMQSPTQQVFSTTLRSTVLKNICQKINRTLNSALSLSAAAELELSSLKDAGNLLYKSLFPSDLQVFLANLNQPLLILTEEPEIPWELLHDEENFFGMKYSMGRCLVWNENIPLEAMERAPDSSFLIIANPAEDLPEAEKETSVLLDYLRSQGATYTYLAGNQATLEEVLLQLNSGKYHFIHYCGHIGMDENASEYALLLGNGESIFASEIAKLDIAAAVVFLNGCYAAVEDKFTSTFPSGMSNGSDSKNLENLSSAFLLAGAQTVVGSVGGVPDLGARLLAESFYNLVLQGESLGDALRQARCSLYQGRQGGFAWASFIMYGNPALKLTPAKPLPWYLPEWLKEITFDETVREIIRLSIELAEKKGMAVNTIFLLLAMLQQPDSFLQRIIKHQKLELERITETLYRIIGKLQPEATSRGRKQLFKFSHNTKNLLLIAAKQAEKEECQQVGERHILQAIQRLPHSEAHKILLQQEIKLKASLESKTESVSPAPIIEIPTDLRDIFHSDGYLDQSIFSITSRLSLYSAAGFADNLGHQAIGTPHLFVGLISTGESLAHRLLLKQGKSPIEIIEKLEKILSSTTAHKPKGIKLHISSFSGNLLNALSLCSKMVKENKPPLIKESHLLAAILEEGRYSSCRILEDVGIGLKQLSKGIKHKDKSDD